MVAVFVVLAMIAGFWEVWAIRAFLIGSPMWSSEGSALWGIGFIANTGMMLWMLVDCFARPLKPTIRNRWIATIIFLGVVGGAAYFWFVKIETQQNRLDPI